MGFPPSGATTRSRPVLFLMCSWVRNSQLRAYESMKVTPVRSLMALIRLPLHADATILSSPWVPEMSNSPSSVITTHGE